MNVFRLARRALLKVWSGCLGSHAAGADEAIQQIKNSAKEQDVEEVEAGKSSQTSSQQGTDQASQKQAAKHPSKHAAKAGSGRCLLCGLLLSLAILLSLLLGLLLSRRFPLGLGGLLGRTLLAGS